MSEQFNNSILNLARQQISEEYIKSKSEDLANWLLECDRVWKEEGVMLPYPTYSFYPSEEDIIARAKLLSGASIEESVEEPNEELIDAAEKVSVNEEISIIKETIAKPIVTYKKKRKWIK